MNTIYTTTLTDEAVRRGISVEVIDSETPIFVLKRGSRSIRCYNGLTDMVGAVTFHLAQNKILCNRFLRMKGLPVPAQIKYEDAETARKFLKQRKKIVVKPAAEWGGRGVSVGVRTSNELDNALRKARRFGEETLLEQYVNGVDHRLIFVNRKFVAAIRRTPACVIGNGVSTLKELVKRKNRKMTREDPSHRIPLDAETRRNVESLGLTLDAIPRKGRKVRVRLTANYHTGGDVEDITDSVDRELVKEGRRVARAFDIPLLGVDFLVNQRRGRHWVIEASPDVAISPPEGYKVARKFLDYLFPE